MTSSVLRVEKLVKDLKTQWSPLKGQYKVAQKWECKVVILLKILQEV